MKISHHFERKPYNKLYEITGISTNKEIEVKSIGAVSGASTTGIGATVTNGAFGTLTGMWFNR